MAGFYVLAVGTAAVLVSVAYGIAVFKSALAWKVALVCIAAAATILWSIVPRVDRFVPPGPIMEPDREPRLFSLIQDVANATGQQMPAEVYLLNDVNAFVAQRGGVMGAGGRRVMGIGLPLMHAVSIQELKAILAHEFGHYHAGDVRLGPWIYKTRAAIERTVRKLSQNVLQRLFVAYGNLFLRLTHAVSRQQEFIADALAARVAGAGAMVSGLRQVHGAAIAFRLYWNSEVGPVLNAGHLPPLIEGFEQFMRSQRVSALVHASVRKEETEGTTSEFDTHPSLRERVEALGAAPRAAVSDPRPALSLLSDPRGWERRLLGAAINEDWARSLKPLPWDRVIDVVYVPAWRAQVREHGSLLRGVTVARPPFRSPQAVNRELQQAGIATTDPAIALQSSVMAAALCLALLDSGWSATTAPGEEVVFRRGADELRPYPELTALAVGQLAPADWIARCTLLGIDGLRLDPRAAPAPVGSV